MEASTPTDGSGKRSRKPKTFAGYVTETNEGYFEEGEQGLAAAAPAAEQQQQQPQTKRRRSSTASASTLSTPKRQQQQNSSSGLVANNPAAAGGSVRKVAGVQNATKRALEWLQYGDLSVSELTQSLPKLSKARVEIVMEALRAAGLVTLVRKHEPDASGEDHVTEVYRFSAGRSAAEALEIGGGKPVALGSISKRIKTSQAELAGLNERINVLKEAAKSDPDPQQVLDILRQFMKQDKSLEEDPFYRVAYKATGAVANKTAAAARAAAVAEAKKKAEDASTAAAASETRRKSQEAVRRQREQEAAAVQARREAEESEARAESGAKTTTSAAITTVDYMAASSASTTVVAAAAFSAAVSSAALPTVSGSVVSTALSSSLPSVDMGMSPATPAQSSPPAGATTAVAGAPTPFVGELGGLVVSGIVSPRSIPPPPSDAQQ